MGEMTEYEQCGSALAPKDPSAGTTAQRHLCLAYFSAPSQKHLDRSFLHTRSEKYSFATAVFTKMEPKDTMARGAVSCQRMCFLFPAEQGLASLLSVNARK
jgi:hypothetical protein